MKEFDEYFKNNITNEDTPILLFGTNPFLANLIMSNVKNSQIAGSRSRDLCAVCRLTKLAGGGIMEISRRCGAKAARQKGGRFLVYRLPLKQNMLLPYWLPVWG